MGKGWIGELEATGLISWILSSSFFRIVMHWSVLDTIIFVGP